jgi:hypothetical protein
MPNMPEEQLRAIAYSVADVECLSTAHDKFETLVPLTPQARAQAMMDGHKVTVSASDFGDFETAQISQKLAEQRTEMERIFAGVALPEREIVYSFVDRIAFGLGRVWESIGTDGPWLIPVDGKPVIIHSKLDAYELTLRNCLEPRLRDWSDPIDAYQSPPIPTAFTSLRTGLIMLAKAWDLRTPIVTGSGKKMYGLPEALAERGVRMCIVEGARGNWSDYLSLLKQFCALFRRGYPISIRTIRTNSGDATKLLNQIIADMPEGRLRDAMIRAEDVLRVRLDIAQAARSDVRLVVEQLAPQALCSAELSRTADWLVAEACGELGILRWVVARNAQTPCAEPMAVDAKRRYMLARAPQGLTDNLVIWSPWFARAAQQYCTPSPGPRLVPLQLKHPVSSRAPSSTGMRRILVADTFASWWMTNWVFMQTSNEFIDGLKRLKAAVAQLPNTELVVRLKEKPECRAHDVKHLIGTDGPIKFETRSEPFPVAAAAADLITAFFSTTLLEAIEIGRPVFLFGGTDRVRFLPARTTPPTGSNERDTVYALPQGESTGELAAFLDDILNAHAGKPLTRKERRAFSWAKTALDIQGLANSILATEERCESV